IEAISFITQYLHLPSRHQSRFFYFFFKSRTKPRSTLFPYTTLFRSVLEAGEVGDFHGGERLDLDAGVPLRQAAEHVEVVAESQLRVQAAHDVELSGRVVARGLGLSEHLVEAARVGPVLLRHARERAE